MASTTITTISSQGLTVSGSGQTVSIAVTGGVPDIYADAAYWSLFNQGEISGGIGIYVASGTAAIANQGYISGQTAIDGNVILQNTGLITGHAGPGVLGAGSIVNRGTILGGLPSPQGTSGAIGVALTSGTLVNGLIGLVRGGYQGVHFSGTGTVVNLGTIQGVDSTGVVLAAGGSLVNGSSLDPGALIYGNFGGVSLAGAGTLVNYGHIVSPTGGGPRNGIGLAGTGLVVNSGTVSGFNGIDAGLGTIENSGTISGGAMLSIAIPFAGYTYISGAGVLLGGGTLANAGLVHGGDIPAFPAPHAGTAGAGVTLDAGYALNTGGITGGTASGYRLTGGSGVLAMTGTLANTGHIFGGNGYNGGTGLTVLAGAQAQNSGTIAGGAGTFGGAGVLLTGGTLANTGSIAGGAGTSWNFAPGLAAGVDLYTGLLINSGNITGGAEQHVGIDIGAGTLRNAGTISGATGVLAQSGQIVNSGLITGTAVGVDIDSGTVENAGTIAGHYAVYMAQSAQRLVADPGAVFLGNVAAKGTGGTLELAAGTGTLDMGASFSGFTTIAFDTGGQWELGGGLAQLAGGEIITGFTLGDTLELEGFAASSAVFVPGTGLELAGGTAAATLALTGDFAADGFIASADSLGTRIAICYTRGTRIMTVDGERPIERLRIGDELPAYFAGMRRIKWIGRQRFSRAELADERARWPVRIGAGALGAGLPRRALTVSPGHSVLIGGTLLLARFLVNGVTITQTQPVADVEYYLIEFNCHDCLLAEGAWAESFADGPGLRDNFDNAAEFFRLYPAYETPREIALCAPRPELGQALAAALRPVVERAARGRPGRLRGRIDLIEGRRVEGWAQDETWPELPQRLEFSAGGKVLGEALACHYRADLAAAGIGTGHAHFVFTAPRDFPPAALHVRRAGGR